MQKNYAKSKDGRDFIFFEPPAMPELPSGTKPQDWWLWVRPQGSNWTKFRLIGETTFEWCANSGHTLQVCEKCKARPARAVPN